MSLCTILGFHTPTGERHWICTRTGNHNKSVTHLIVSRIQRSQRISKLSAYKEGRAFMRALNVWPLTLNCPILTANVTVSYNTNEDSVFFIVFFLLLYLPWTVFTSIDVYNRCVWYQSPGHFWLWGYSLDTSHLLSFKVNMHATLPTTTLHYVSSS